MHSWHTGISMYMLWTSLGCLILFVNSILWNDNVMNWAPVWCDISARYLIGASVGIPASSLCMTRRLYYVTKISFRKDSKKRRREIMIDVLIGIGLPCVVMALQYVVQSNRFIIVEQCGCYPSVDKTLAAYFLVLMWPLVIGLISLVYAILTFRVAFQRKQQLKEIHHAGFSISLGHYPVDIIFTVPLSIYVIILNAYDDPVGPYASWASVHTNVSHIAQYPAVQLTRWLYILCAFLIFAFFGWAEEARDFYRQAFWSICHRLGYQRVSKSRSPADIPVYDINQQMRLEHLSMPLQARVRRYSLQSSFCSETPPRPGSLSESSSLRLSVDKGLIENPPRLPSLSGLGRYTNRISWEELDCDRDRSLQGTGPLV
ncbi:pheromone A receptor-domain-containing protein [Boletus edulis]|nr:pheromone A receptor-domain-containing protein [Boletus edulis]